MISRGKKLFNYILIIITVSILSSCVFPASNEDNKPKEGQEVEFPSSVNTLDDELALLTKKIPGFGGYRFKREWPTSSIH